MKAIIPAAGMGKRLVPHTLNRPKVMVPLAGKPMLAIIADSLLKAGFDTLSIIVGYKKEAITDYFSKDYPGCCQFFIQEEMKGLGHAILYGLEDVDEPALIILGDTIIDVDLSHIHKMSENMIGVVRVDDPTRFGIVEVDEEKHIISMVEKPENPPSDLAISGLYYIRSQRILKKAIEKLIEKDIKTRGEYQLTDALVLMLEEGETFIAEEISGWYDCGTRKTLLSTNTHLLENGYAEKLSECENVKIIEPVYIGKNVKLSNSYIGPNVSICDNVTIDRSVIQDSMLFKGSTVTGCKLDNSLLGVGAKADAVIGQINIGDDQVVE